MNIGIIGYGIVGRSIAAGFQSRCSLYIYDSSPKSYADDTAKEKIVLCQDVSAVIKNAEFIFVCVPTPRKKNTNHSFDGTHLDATLRAIAQSKLTNKKHILIIKSTVVPSKIREYVTEYPQLNLVICPEFLIEKNFIECFLKPNYRIYGGENEQTRKVHQLFEKHSICQPCKIAYTDYYSASIIKYMINSFLAMKVSYMNQFYDIAKLSGVQMRWEQLEEIFHYDTRVGNSHSNVPGHDGQRGWGGKCFPKDVSAIIDEAKMHGYTLDILQAVWDYNYSLRNDID